MAKRRINTGSTDQTVDVFIQDSSSTVGDGLTGLVYNTAGLTCYYRKGATGTPTALTLATQTVGGAHSDGGFVAVDGTNCPGQYRLDLSDTMVAAAGMLTVYLRGATNMVPCVLEIEVGPAPSDVTQWLGTAVSTPTVAGVPNVNVKTWNDLTTVALPLTPTTAGRTLTVSAAGNASAVLADSVAHGGSAATLRLGSSSSTPAFYATNTGGPAVQFSVSGPSADPALFIEQAGSTASAAYAVYISNLMGGGMFVGGGTLAITLSDASAGVISGNLAGKVLGSGSGTIIGTGVRADVRAWNGTAPNNLQSGRVDAYIGALASGVITSAAYAANAIVAASIATDAREALATALLDLSNGVETSYTVRQSLRLIAAACAGKRSNTGTSSEQFDAIGAPGTARIVGNLNASGDGTPVLTP